MAHRSLPPLLAGVLWSAGITAAFVAFGLGWAAVFSLYNVGAFVPHHVGRAEGVGEMGAAEVKRPAIWLVDGFNVLHAGVLRGRERGQWWREAGRAQLLELARSFDDPEAEVWIVFDGPREAPSTPATPRLRVVFAPSADEWLLRHLRSAPDPSQLGVVTGDRRLAIRSRRRGAHVIMPREFLDRCRTG
jgi:predicted RNA-binding protein with PIN domain